MDVKVTTYYVKIYDSYQFSKIDFDTCLDYIEDNYVTEVFNYRSKKSLKREWAIQNLLYRWCINRDKTLDVTFEISVPKWKEILYKVFGLIAMIYID